MKLTAKFNLVLVLVLSLGLVVTGVLSYRILRKNAEREVLQTAGLMMEAALAMRSYTVAEIRPLLLPLMVDEFHPQTVPAYAATQAFDKLREQHNDYTYKEATLNPTNPRDRATDWETDIIQEFRNFGGRDSLTGVRDTPTGQSLYMARPIKISNGACLACHSTPEAAPAPMIAKYGRNNGFGWQLNEIVGAQIVSVPMSLPLEHARQAFLTFMGALVGVFMVIIIVLNVMLSRIIIRPITRMAATADEVSKGNFAVAEFQSDGADEVSTLGTSFNRMRRSLERAIGMLE
ncbi:MAG: DUF3365 domain-containing protein [Gammaproteobacteria bacterium]|nr:DUF3365 domain-containing protein [Gammaproteobacteria bacterium]